MSTVIRASVSKKNPYYISRERYHELKHFCRQYKEWELYCSSLSGYQMPSSNEVKSADVSNPTEECAMLRELYLQKMELVDKAAKETDPVIGRYILEGVVNGFPYDVLNARFGVPCCKDSYYILYRKFFWILDNLRK